MDLFFNKTTKNNKSNINRIKYSLSVLYLQGNIAVTTIKNNLINNLLSGILYYYQDIIFMSVLQSSMVKSTQKFYFFVYLVIFNT